MGGGVVSIHKPVHQTQCSIGVEPHQIAADGWAIGYDDRFPLTARIQQGLCFARYSEHENLYAHPLVSAKFCVQGQPLIIF